MILEIVVIWCIVSFLLFALYILCAWWVQRNLPKNYPEE